MSAHRGLCCKTILGVPASNIDSRPGSNAQCCFTSHLVLVRLFPIFVCESSSVEFCNTIGQLRTHAPQQSGHVYSITSSALTIRVSGTVRPSALAVLRLIT